MTEKNAVGATYKSHVEAESAVKELQSTGFNMKQLSWSFCFGTLSPKKCLELLPHSPLGDIRTMKERAIQR